MTPLWVLLKLQYQILHGGYELGGNLWTSVVDSNAVTIVTHPAVKGGMDDKFNFHPQWLSFSF
jgi:hypothetical protein